MSSEGQLLLTGTLASPAVSVFHPEGYIKKKNFISANVQKEHVFRAEMMSRLTETPAV